MSRRAEPQPASDRQWLEARRPIDCDIDRRIAPWIQVQARFGGRGREGGGVRAYHDDMLLYWPGR